MSFNIALTGLSAVNEKLDAVSNNIANVGTTGFKSSRAEFGSIYADTQAMGVEVLGLTQSISQGGSIVGTGRSLDLAISGGGFFVTKAGNGDVSYTRAGVFGTDKNNNLVNANGQLLQGYPIGTNGELQEGNLGTLSLQSGNLPAEATDAMSFVANFDANESLPIVTPFNAEDADSFNSTYVTKVFDSQGKEHTLTQYFVKTADNIWTSHYAVDGQNVGSQMLTFDSNGILTSPTNDAVNKSIDPAAALAEAQALAASTAAAVVPASTAANNAATIASAEQAAADTAAGIAAASRVTADADEQAAITAEETLAATDPTDPLYAGNQIAAANARATADASAATAATDQAAANQAATDAAAAQTAAAIAQAAYVAAQQAANGAAAAVAAGASAIPVTVVTTTLGGGVAQLSIDIDYSGMTQYGSDFIVTTNKSTGYAAGEQTGLTVEKDGKVYSTYSNGERKLQGQVALATFANLDGLKNVSGTSWVETSESGQALEGVPGVGSFGDLTAAALESSNVDLTQQLVELMEGQRNYQANTKVLSSDKEMTQVLFNAI